MRGPCSAWRFAGALIPRLPQRPERWLHPPDALGLGLFSVVGAAIALEQGLSPFIAALFGVNTGTFGGVIGDIVGNETPDLFRPTIPLYASVSFVGCWVYVLLALVVPVTAAQWSAVAFIVAMRMLALKRGWSFPAPAQ